MKNSIETAGKQTEININDRMKVLSLQGISPNSPFNIKISRNKKFNSTDILRLHSQLIRAFINRDIESNDAKTLSYLCSNYLEALGMLEIEERLKLIEERVNNEKF
jgi:hypothetical protein